MLRGKFTRTNVLVNLLHLVHRFVFGLLAKVEVLLAPPFGRTKVINNQVVKLMDQQKSIGRHKCRMINACNEKIGSKWSKKIEGKPNRIFFRIELGIRVTRLGEFT
jgi:hypothetical protein